MGIPRKAQPSPDGISQDPGPCEPIAIVGMAMRLPGGVYNGEEFWSFLVEKKGGLCDVPADHDNHDAFHDAGGKLDTVQMKQGYFLHDVKIRQFDTDVFSTSKTELELLDPQQRQLLEVMYECLESAGCTSFRGSDIGCYFWVFREGWQDLNAKKDTTYRPQSGDWV